MESRFEPNPGPSRPASAQHALEVELGAEPAAAANARSALRALDDAVEPQVLNDVRLLVSELVTNSVRHSSASPQASVRLQVRPTDTAVRVEVADPGTGFDPEPRDGDRSRPGGWGLYLVDHLADRWGVVCDQLTRVWFEIDRVPRSGRAAPAG